MLPSPDVNWCPETELVGIGMSFASTRRGRIAVVGGQEAPPADRQLIDCPWGDLSFDLYQADTRFDAGPLLDGEVKAMPVILEGGESDASSDDRSCSTGERKTTVYLTIRRIR